MKETAMPILDSRIDRDALSIEFTAEFDAPIERVWALWEDPRQLERWWGPPGWPATFTRHDLTVGGESRYHMTGPQGEISAAWFRMTKVEPPTVIEFDDGFAGEDGEPDLSKPIIRGRVSFDAVSANRTSMLTTVSFDSLDDFDTVVNMGMHEGMSAAMGQIDGILLAR
jgi:uncharacterized protein YndB with AHSA1/START domain